MTEKRVDSWPFDSAWAGYDDEGYPVYDRAVASEILRNTFREFFTDGVFPSNRSGLALSKGEGLTINIGQGSFIIDGCIGVVPSGGISLPITIEAGHRAYGIFLRNDSRIENRSCYIVIKSGEPNAEPEPPSVETNIPGVKEYLLGYIDIPSNAADLTGARITNRKGTKDCPYAAPFKEIDIEDILIDVREQANAQYDLFIQYLNDNREFIDSALEGTVAGALQSAINKINGTIQADIRDDEFIAYCTQDNPS